MTRAALPHRSNEYSIISLYTGAGGLDLGFEAAGYRTRIGVECDRDAVRTLSKNRPEWPIIDARIDSPAASSAELLRVAGLKQGEPDLLIGGPPCQPFSKSGYWATGDSKRLADPRADTIAHFLRVLRDTLPRAFLLENVPGLAFSRKDEGLLFLERTLGAINREIGTNYSMEAALLRAVEHGIPQDRQRVFVIGSRDGHTFTFPRATHTNPARALEADVSAAEEHSSALLPWRNSWDAIGDLENIDDPGLRLTGKWADLLPSIPPGKNYLFFTDRGGSGIPLFGWRTRYWSFLLKLAKALPSWTIAAQPGPAIGPFHWKNRRLSPLELMRLQTFPAGYTIVGDLRSTQRQVGNAVPSALAERLALELRRQFFGERYVESCRLTLLPQRRLPLPDEEEALPVPPKYLDLVGDHKAHPGTGRGPGALRRETRIAADDGAVSDAN